MPTAFAILGGIFSTDILSLRDFNRNLQLITEALPFPKIPLDKSILFWYHKLCNKIVVQYFRCMIDIEVIYIKRIVSKENLQINKKLNDIVTFYLPTLNALIQLIEQEINTLKPTLPKEG